MVLHLKSLQKMSNKDNNMLSGLGNQTSSTFGIGKEFYIDCSLLPNVIFFLTLNVELVCNFCLGKVKKAPRSLTVVHLQTLICQQNILTALWAVSHRWISLNILWNINIKLAERVYFLIFPNRLIRELSIQCATTVCFFDKLQSARKRHETLSSVWYIFSIRTKTN